MIKMDKMIVSIKFQEENTNDRNDAGSEEDSDEDLLTPIVKKELNSNEQQPHSSIGNGKKPYACKKCDQSFNHASNLSRHKKSIHEGKCYMCDQCNKVFSQLCHLKTHKDVVHEGIRGTQVCQLCGKCFHNLSILKRHFMKHTGLFQFYSLHT